MNTKPENPLMLPLKQAQEVFSKLAVQDVLKSPSAVKLFENLHGKGSEKILQREHFYLTQMLQDEKTGERLRTAQPYSLFCAISRCISSGLSLNPALNHGYIQVMNGVAKYAEMWQGKVKILIDAGVLESVEFNEVIYDCDKFKMNMGRIVNYEPVIPRPKTAQPIGAAIRANLSSGRIKDLFLDIATLDKRRAATKNKDKNTKEIYGPWKDWWEPMVQKTMVNTLFSALPKSAATTKIADEFLQDEEQDAQYEEVDQDEEAPTITVTEPVATEPTEEYLRLTEKRTMASLELDRCKSQMDQVLWEKFSASVTNLPEGRLQEMIDYLKAEFPPAF